MSNQPYRYDPQANVLRQRAEMKKPKAWNYRVRHTASDGGHAAHQLQLLKYEQHLASLPAYTPVSGWVPEVGKEYIFGEHFSVKRLNPQFREDETYEEYLKCFEEGYRFQPYTKEYFTLYRDAKVAVPIEQKQEEPVATERTFTLQDMIECWEAAVAFGDANCETGGQTRLPSKKQYFKTKFNINIDDQGK